MVKLAYKTEKYFLSIYDPAKISGADAKIKASILTIKFLKDDLIGFIFIFFIIFLNSNLKLRVLKSTNPVIKFNIEKNKNIMCGETSKNISAKESKTM